MQTTNKEIIDLSVLYTEFLKIFTNLQTNCMMNICHIEVFFVYNIYLIYYDAKIHILQKQLLEYPILKCPQNVKDIDHIEKLDIL